MNFVYALDAVTGKPIAGFGDHGRIDLREKLGREPAASQSVYLTSPGMVYKDLLIVGGRNPETPPSPPGDVRAFDVRTGKAALVVSHHPPSGRSRLRNLAQGRVEDQPARPTIGLA